MRAPEHKNPNKYLYEHDLREHTVILSDWMHHLAEEDFPGMTSRSPLSQSVLINGHGRFYNVCIMLSMQGL